MYDVWTDMDDVDKIFNTVYQKKKENKHNIPKKINTVVHTYKYPSCSDVV